MLCVDFQALLAPIVSSLLLNDKDDARTHTRICIYIYMYLFIVILHIFLSV